MLDSGLNSAGVLFAMTYMQNTLVGQKELPIEDIIKAFNFS